MLSDILDFQMKIVFCGSVIGSRPALQRSYYPGPGNKFWSILHKTGLTPVQIKADYYSSAGLHGLGLIDSNSDACSLTRKILRYAPAVLCFNGKKAAGSFFKKRNLDFGYQKECIGSTRIFIAPSTSGKANRYWDEKWWFMLADSVALTVSKVTSENYYQPDEICKTMENIDPRTGVSTKTSEDDFVRAILDVELHFSIPLHIRNIFEIAKALFAYGYLYYPFCTLAVEQGLKGLEAVISHKYEIAGGFQLNTKGRHPGLREKIDYLFVNGLVSEKQKDLLHDFRHLRNTSFHPRYQQILGHYDGMMRALAGMMDQIWLS